MYKRLIFTSLCFILCVLPIISQENDKKFELLYLNFKGRMQDIVTYDFNGDGLTDILISSVDSDDNLTTKYLYIYFQKKDKLFSKDADQTIKLSDRTSITLFGNLVAGKAIEICFLATDGLYYYPFDDNRIADTPKKLFHTETFFDNQSTDSISIWSYPEDLDNNGLDDVIIPTNRGYKIYMQTEPGKFGKVSYISIPTNMTATTSDTQAVFLNVEKVLPRYNAIDINGDGRKDIAIIKKDMLYYFFQKSDGYFISTPRKVTLQALYEQAKTDTVNVSLANFKDVNNDGKGDIFVTKISGELGLFESITTKILIFLGDGSGRFQNPNSIVDLSGVNIEPALIDLNQDGNDDVIVSSVRTDLVKTALDKFIFDAIDITYFIYAFDKKINNYVEGGPAYSRTVSVKIKNIESNLSIESIPFIYFQGDYNGDGRPDMAIMNTDGVLETRLGKIGDRIDFTIDPYYKIKLDRQPKYLSMIDINNDKRSDIILAYRGSPVGILISK